MLPAVGTSAADERGHVRRESDDLGDRHVVGRLERRDGCCLDIGHLGRSLETAGVFAEARAPQRVGGEAGRANGARVGERPGGGAVPLLDAAHEPPPLRQEHPVALLDRSGELDLPQLVVDPVEQLLEAQRVHAEQAVDDGPAASRPIRRAAAT